MMKYRCKDRKRIY